MFIQCGKYKWINVLQDLVNSYNRSTHSVIGMAPINVDSNDVALQHAQYLKTPKVVRFKFKLDDHVHISKVKGIFTNSYVPAWSEEVFTVVQQKKTEPAMYKL